MLIREAQFIHLKSRNLNSRFPSVDTSHSYLKGVCFKCQNYMETKRDWVSGCEYLVTSYVSTKAKKPSGKATA